MEDEMDFALSSMVVTAGFFLRHRYGWADIAVQLDDRNLHGSRQTKEPEFDSGSQVVNIAEGCVEFGGHRVLDCSSLKNSENRHGSST
jgi:hypothetical protein